MGLRDIGARLPPGFRFYPNDEELVCHYLCKKVANSISNNDDAEEANVNSNSNSNSNSIQPSSSSLVDIDLHTCEPWQLPEVAKLNNTEWYFFSFRDRKYATGYRTNRATTTGYWKATGKDRVVLDPRTREIVGMRKTLVFYRNRAPNGIKTGWIMHEFRLESPNMPPKEDWVLCRVFEKSKEESNSNNKYCNHQIQITNTPMPMALPPALISQSSCSHQKWDIATHSSTHTPHPQHQPIIKEGSSDTFFSFTDLINSEAIINDHDSSFFSDMDMDMDQHHPSNSCSFKWEDHHAPPVGLHHHHVPSPPPLDHLEYLKFDATDPIY